MLDNPLTAPTQHSGFAVALAIRRRSRLNVLRLPQCYRAGGRGETTAMIEQATERLWVLGPITLVALFLSWALLLLLRPWLARYMLVQPSARSSHYRPTPQGGGMAVVLAVLVAVWV